MHVTHLAESDERHACHRAGTTGKSREQIRKKIRLAATGCSEVSGRRRMVFGTDRVADRLWR
jgi:hypothetical protein